MSQSQRQNEHSASSLPPLHHLSRQILTLLWDLFPTTAAQNGAKHTTHRKSTLIFIVCVLFGFFVVVVCVCVLHSLLQACLSWFYATDMKTMKCQISLFRRFLTFGRAENATSGCAFLGSSDGMLQLGCIHTAKATEFKNSCEIQPCLICFSVWPVSVGPNLFDSE